MSSLAVAWANLTPSPEPAPQRKVDRQLWSKAASRWPYFSREIIAPQDALREARLRGAALMSLHEAQSILQLGALCPGEDVWALVLLKDISDNEDAQVANLTWIQVSHLCLVV